MIAGGKRRAIAGEPRARVAADRLSRVLDRGLVARFRAGYLPSLSISGIIVIPDARSAEPSGLSETGYERNGGSETDRVGRPRAVSGPGVRIDAAPERDRRPRRGSRRAAGSRRRPGRPRDALSLRPQRVDPAQQPASSAHRTGTDGVPLCRSAGARPQGADRADDECDAARRVRSAGRGRRDRDHDRPCRKTASRRRMAAHRSANCWASGRARSPMRALPQRCGICGTSRTAPTG